MKKLMTSLVAVLFLAVVSGPVSAAEPTPVKTPVTKSMKHKKLGHKRSKKAKKAVKPSSTPTVK